MKKLNLAIFNNQNEVENAVLKLEKKGYNPKEISVITKETEKIKEITKTSDSATMAGVTTGTGLGGLAGLLFGLGVITVPGFAGLLIAGPLSATLGLTGLAATTVSGALSGALLGGLVGTLVDLGIPEDKAKEYELKISKGAILLIVPSKIFENQDESWQIMEEAGAEEIYQINTPKNY